MQPITAIIDEGLSFRAHYLFGRRFHSSRSLSIFSPVPKASFISTRDFLDFWCTRRLEHGAPGPNNGTTNLFDSQITSHTSPYIRWPWVLANDQGERFLCTSTSSSSCRLFAIYRCPENQLFYFKPHLAWGFQSSVPQSLAHRHIRHAGRRNSHMGVTLKEHCLPFMLP